MKPKHLLSVALLLIGTAIFTYATTRTWTTQHVLERAGQHVHQFLEDQDMMAGLSNVARHDRIAPEMHEASRAAWGRVLEAGGMYFWWNDAIPYWGAGVFLVSVGLLVPFVGPRRKSTPD